MANTAAWCTSFKVELLKGIHALGTTVVRASTAKDTLKAALYPSSASLGASTTSYPAAGELTGGGYTAGGATVTNATEPTSDGTVGIWTPSASVVFAGLTQPDVQALLLYNSTQTNRAMGVFTFPTQNLVAGTLTLTMPANAAATALLQIN